MTEENGLLTELEEEPTPFQGVSQPHNHLMATILHLPSPYVPVLTRGPKFELGQWSFPVAYCQSSEVLQQF